MCVVTNTIPSTEKNLTVRPHGGPKQATYPPTTSICRSLLSALGRFAPKKKNEPAKFVKRLEDIPEISLLLQTPIQVALSLAEQALVGQFIGLWPSPKSTEIWVNKNSAPLIKNDVTSYFLGRGFFLFEFTSKDDKDLIFQNGPYFMGPQGLYLNKWTPDFDPATDVLTAILVWVRLPNLQVHCWNWDSLKHISNALGKFIDKANNKDQYDYARIDVEVDLEVALPEAIKMKVGSWTHLQKLDYEQLHFKCRKCHVYKHFARGCPSNADQIRVPPQQTPSKMEQENKFSPLSSQIEETHEADTQKSSPLAKGTPSSPKGASLVESSKGNTIEVEEAEQESESSEEEGKIRESQALVRRSTRGRKTNQEKREQENFKDKLQGSQPNLEKLLASNRRW
eukprot:PITA_26670